MRHKCNFIAAQTRRWRTCEQGYIYFFKIFQLRECASATRTTHTWRICGKCTVKILDILAIIIMHTHIFFVASYKALAFENINITYSVVTEWEKKSHFFLQFQHFFAYQKLCHCRTSCSQLYYIIHMCLCVSVCKEGICMHACIYTYIIIYSFIYTHIRCSRENIFPLLLRVTTTVQFRHNTLCTYTPWYIYIKWWQSEVAPITCKCYTHMFDIKLGMQP